jgi:hypothetical protein
VARALVDQADVVEVGEINADGEIVVFDQERVENWPRA